MIECVFPTPDGPQMTALMLPGSRGPCRDSIPLSSPTTFAVSMRVFCSTNLIVLHPPLNARSVYIPHRMAIRASTTFMKFINNIIDKLPLELHVYGYNYCGAGTKLKKRLKRGDNPINELDRACLLHDKSYAKFEDLKRRREADLELSHAASQRFFSKDASLGEKITAALVKGAMVVKRKIGAGLKRRGKSRRTRRRTPLPPRVIPTPRFGGGKRGGFLVPAAALVTAGLGAYKTIRDIRNAKRVLEERERHHRALEKIAHERGIRLGTGFRKKRGGKLKKRKSKCSKKTLRFL